MGDCADSTDRLRTRVERFCQKRTHHCNHYGCLLNEDPQLVDPLMPVGEEHVANDLFQPDVSERVTATHTEAGACVSNMSTVRLCDETFESGVSVKSAELTLSHT
jgi:hypothetical protein